MKKINYSEIKGYQLVDIRTQHDYQRGHVKNSLNFNRGNFKKYANYYLTPDQPILFIVGSEEENLLAEISALAEEKGFNQDNGYILINEIPNKELEKIQRIPAEEFLNKEDDYILLDVRQPAEITRPAPEKNLVNIPFEDLINDYPSLDKDKEIYTLCGSGNRSTAAASYLSTKGFKPVVVEGGMKAVQKNSQ